MLTVSARRPRLKGTAVRGLTIPRSPKGKKLRKKSVHSGDAGIVKNTKKKRPSGLRGFGQEQAGTKDEKGDSGA